MRALLLVTTILCVALGGGIASAWLLAGSASALPSAAGWHPLPSPDAPAGNPYRRDPAGLSFPPGGKADDKRLLAALRSDDGAFLERRCSYALAGRMPSARIWTLSAVDEDFGPAPENPAGLSSAGVVWEPDGRIAVTVGPEPAAGNWLPLAGTGRFVLLAGLYDTRTAVEASTTPVLLPSITRLGCRADLS